MKQIQQRFSKKNERLKSMYCEAFSRVAYTLAKSGLVRCLDIGEGGREVAYAPGHAIMSGEVTRRAALRGDGLSMMSKLA